ncbi:reverse transcriptase domain-containing protein [Tanacetum coccineum]
MTGVPRHIAEHRLNIREGCLPIRQKKIRQAPERNKAIQEEVEKLVDARIMKEVHYHSWLSNPIMVKKHDGSWQICVDFKNLNQACPKDGYPLPEIDWKVESLCGYPFKCFLDAYKGYHQIKMAKEDEEKIAFTRARGYSEAEVAFKQMKKLIAELPMLAAPKEKEELIMYLAAAKEAIRAVLMTERGDQPIKQLLSKSEISGRMLKWKFELEGYDIQYRPRTSIKVQILADFIVERLDEESPDELMAEPEELPEPWTLFTDGSSCLDGSGTGLILTSLEGVKFMYAMRFRFEATNNEDEYAALIAGLRIAEQMGIKNLQANYSEKVKTLASNFKEFSIKQVSRRENKKADALSKIASASFAHLSKQVLMEELKEKFIHEKEVLAIVEEEGQTWMTPICEYLTKEILPKDKKKARVVHRKASRYTMINGTLYKKSFLGPWLRCVRPLQTNYVLKEIHKGSCSMHFGHRSVVAKAIRMGYYWPTMHSDARKLIREYCQVHCPIPRNQQQNLTPITSPWPFYKWGIDIARPFPEGPVKVKFLIELLTTSPNGLKQSLLFDLPGEIVSDNGKQFCDNPFKDWSLGEGIKARLDERSKDWIGELSYVLWAQRTMIKSSNRETTFSLTYGTKAVILTEIGMPTLRTAEVDLTKNDEALEINLDLIEEKREQAAIQEVKSKAKMEKYHNSKVRSTSFRPGYMVYRSNDASHTKDEGKLGPK